MESTVFKLASVLVACGELLSALAVSLAIHKFASVGAAISPRVDAMAVVLAVLP